MRVMISPGSLRIPEIACTISTAGQLKTGKVSKTEHHSLYLEVQE